MSQKQKLLRDVLRKGNKLSAMKIGYARVSTQDQHLAIQNDLLLEAGCERIYKEKVSGAKRARPELDRLLGACPKIQPGRSKVLNLPLGNTDLAV